MATLIIGCIIIYIETTQNPIQCYLGKYCVSSLTLTNYILRCSGRQTKPKTSKNLFGSYNHKVEPITFTKTLRTTFER